MKIAATSLLAVTLLVLSAGLFVPSAEASVRVKGYVKKSASTYVMPSHRSSPNHTRVDNWSTKGNYNPYTGKAGTKSIYRFR